MSKEKRIGNYIGTVEYNKDPYHWGRAQVRVDEVYGTPEETPSNMLPWARIMQTGGGFYDGGSHQPPPVGATVLVTFEKGDSDLPYVLGTIPKKPTKRNTYGRADESMGQWTPGAYDSDVPKEVKEDGEETTHVIFKTPKGAALVISEQDGNEYMRLIDRAGQMIELVSNVASGDNQGNASQRGTAVAPTGIGVSKVTVGKIRIIDLEGQHITMDMKAKKIQIESKGDLEKTVAGKETDGITGDLTQTVGGKKSATVTGEDSVQAGTRKVTVSGIEEKDVVGAKTDIFGAAWTITVTGVVTLTAPTVNIISATALNLGGPAGSAVARIGDTVVSGVITSGSAIVKAV